MHVLDHAAFRMSTLEPHLPIPRFEIIISPFAVGDVLEVVCVRQYNINLEVTHGLKRGWFAEGMSG